MFICVDAAEIISVCFLYPSSIFGPLSCFVGIQVSLS